MITLIMNKILIRYQQGENQMSKQISIKRTVGSLRPTNIEYSHSGTYLAVISKQPVELHIYDLANRKISLSAFLKDHEAIESIIHFQLLNKNYIYIIQKGCLRGWEMKQSHPTFQRCPNDVAYGGSNNPVFMDAYKEILAVAEDNYVEFWNVTSGQLINKNNIENQANRIISLQFIQDGSSLMLVDSKGKVFRFLNNPPYFTIKPFLYLNKIRGTSSIQILSATFTSKNYQTLVGFVQYDGVSKSLNLVNLQSQKLISKSQKWPHQFPDAQNEYISFFNNGDEILYKNITQISIFSSKDLNELRGSITFQQNSVYCVDVNQQVPQFSICSRNLINMYQVLPKTTEQSSLLFYLGFIGIVILIPILILVFRKFKIFGDRIQRLEGESQECMEDENETSSGKSAINKKRKSFQDESELKQIV